MRTRAAVLTLAVVTAMLVAPSSAIAATCSFSGQIDPGGDPVTKDCQIVNQSNVDATFYVSVVQSSFDVRDQNGNPVSVSLRDAYVAHFSLSVSVQRVFVAAGVDVLSMPKLPSQVPAGVPYAGYRSTCDGRPLTSLTASTTSFNEANACRIGTVRGAGTQPLPGFETRGYSEALFLDQGGADPQFDGLSLSFSERIIARVPADPSECPAHCDMLTPVAYFR